MFWRSCPACAAQMFPSNRNRSQSSTTPLQPAPTSSKTRSRVPVLKSPVRKEPCHPPRTVVQPDKEALIKRLNRIEGQVRGVNKMVTEDRYCVDILNQVAALQSALDAVAMLLLESHTHGCMQG